MLIRDLRTHLTFRNFHALVQTVDECSLSDLDIELVLLIMTYMDLFALERERCSGLRILLGSPI